MTTQKSCNHKKSKPSARPSDPGKTIYIGNLNYNRDEQGIKWLFSRYGAVKSIELITEPGSDSKSKGYAFVKMVRSKDALKAIKNLDGKIIDGRTLKVSEAIETQKQENVSPPKKKPQLSKNKLTKKTKKTKKKESGLDVLFNYLKG